MRVVLLDLDGTITQSHQGIIACAKKAMKELNMPIPDDAEMRRFIGPSILESFQRNHMPKDLQDLGVQLYRKYYSQVPTFEDPNNSGTLITGNFLNRLYDGIDEQLNILRESGFYLAIASCKPEYQIEPIAKRFGIDKMVDAIYGASRDMSRIKKAQVIRYAFENMKFEFNEDKALMVGDRWTDVDGAKECGIDCLGCGWGYAEQNELHLHGAYRIINNVNELAYAVIEYFDECK